jgi:6-phosphofructokinase 2
MKFGSLKPIVSLAMNPAIDKSSSVEHVIPERKLYCNPPRFEPGGGGVNVSRAIKKLGGDSLLLYPAGGYTGRRLEDLLDEEGIAQRLLSIEGTTRESLAVLEESTGQQYRFGMPGPVLKEDEWKKCLEELSALHPAPAYLVASGSLPPGVPPDFYARVARMGKEFGAKVIVDASGDPLKQALQEGVFLIKPNLREFRDLAGEGKMEESQTRAEAQRLVQAGRCEVLVISLGAAGVLLVSKDRTEPIRPPTVPIASKVGAGDSMVAGIVLSLAGGRTVRDSVLFGIAAGAAAVMTPGSELCRREDTERLYARMLSEIS